ncbi:MAG: hypothetical protein IJW58_02505 [Clostridia bacterium]|nr:hypothetical protein [Clostridia bacterium]
MKVTEFINVLRLYQIDVLLLELIARLLDALIKKMMRVENYLQCEIERLKEKNANK